MYIKNNNLLLIILLFISTACSLPNTSQTGNSGDNNVNVNVVLDKKFLEELINGKKCKCPSKHPELKPTQKPKTNSTSNSIPNPLPTSTTTPSPKPTFTPNKYPIFIDVNGNKKSYKVKPIEKKYSKNSRYITLDTKKIYKIDIKSYGNTKDIKFTVNKEGIVNIISGKAKGKYLLLLWNL